jgi:hypothetical protein
LAQPQDQVIEVVNQHKSMGLQETKKNNARGRETLLTGDSQNLHMEEMICLDALGAGKPTKILFLRLGNG